MDLIEKDLVFIVEIQSIGLADLFQPYGVQNITIVVWWSIALKKGRILSTLEINLHILSTTKLRMG